MRNLFDVFINFNQDPFLAILLLMFFGLYFIIFVLQIRRNDNVLIISIILALFIGFFMLILTSLMEENVKNEEMISSMQSWLKLMWNLFMILLLSVLPVYVFSMVSTTFTNTRHHKGGKKLLATSFLSLWGMTFLGILVAILLSPLIFLSKDYLQIEPGTTIITSSWIEIVLRWYSIIVLITILLAIIFAIIMNTLHKYKHDSGENVIKVIEKVNFSTRQYLKWVSYLVPYVISGMLILLFNNYAGKFIKMITALGIFVSFFFLGLAIVYSTELSIVISLRKNKDEVSWKEFRKKTNTYNINVFAVQSAPILYPITVDYVKMLGVNENVSKTVPTLTTFMGYSMCGGFYPALIIIFTMVQADSGYVDIFSILITISFMIPLILLMTLGMTGVPGADVAIVLGLLSALGLNPTYFFTIYLIEPLLDKFRGVGNSMGFAAASVITNEIYNRKIDANSKEHD